jgi:peptidoglycan/LPS O-acetylase OafA/YrhL
MSARSARSRDDATAVSASGSPVDVAPQFPALDAVRAIGALAVLTTHVAFQTGEYLRNGVWGTFLARLDVGVAVFFVLSAFLLARPHLARAASRVPAPDLRRYAEKRVVRIAPAYWVTATVALLLFPANASAGVGQWLSTFFLVDTYVRDELPHGLTHMWSLAVEVAFYALLPLLMLLALGRARVLRAGRVLAVLAGMVAVSTWWHLYGTGLLEDRTAGATGLWLPGYLSWFAAGIGLALLDVRLRQHTATGVERRLASLGRMPGACWTTVAGLMLLVSTPLAGPVLFVIGTPSETLFKNLVYAVVGTLVVLPGVFADTRHGFGRVMSRRLPRHLGHISYGIFCLHLSLISLVLWSTDYRLFGGDGLQVWLLTLAASLLAAELLYWLVERPALRLYAAWRRSSRTTQQKTRDHATTTNR